jgi:hypothetical protein
MPRKTERREPIRARVTQQERSTLQGRADAELQGNLSEMIRRCLAFGTAHMPAGWSPENPQAGEQQEQG